GDGDPNTTEYAPVGVSGLTSGVSAIAVGVAHACALTTGGAVQCWGWNHYGQLGNGTTTDSYVPTPVPSLQSGVAAIAAGGFSTCALTQTGQLLCWGSVVAGGAENLTPTPITFSTGSSTVSTFTSVALGYQHGCAIATNGAVWCFGADQEGQIGNGTMSPNASGQAELNAAAVAAGGEHSCALLT